MCTCSRRQVLTGAAAGLAACSLVPSVAAESTEQHRFPIAEAQRMRQDAIARGDQPFGAVISKDGAIVGYGPSRVILDRNPDAHAERVAIWDAQKRLGSEDLSGAALFSTSRPCRACEDAAARANVDRMFFGDAATDAGQPQRW